MEGNLAMCSEALLKQVRAYQVFVDFINSSLDSPINHDFSWFLWSGLLAN